MYQREELIFLTIHVVNAGDTIDSIAESYGISPKILIENNDISREEPLVTGQSLVILYPERVHRVKRGETLFSIATSYSLTVKELLRNNPGLIKRPLLENEDVVISFSGQKQGVVETNGYAYPYVDEDILIESLPYMSYLSPFTYGITEEGDLVPLDDERLIENARNYSVYPLMHLSTLTKDGVFSNELASTVLNSEEIQDKLILSIKNKIREKGYRGLDIDFEFVLPKDSILYAEFIEKIRENLSPLGLVVYSALAPKTSDTQRGTLYEGHNYQLIANASDGVLLMTYEWGYTYGPPMAVAPIGPVRNVLEYALSKMNADKIFLGIPNYGYDWTLPFVKGESRADSISNPEAVALARQYGQEILFDEVSKTPHFNYTDSSGRQHEVWFEDARSMKAKYDLISEYGLKGAGYWNLMRPFKTNWSLLNGMFDIYDF